MKDPKVVVVFLSNLWDVHGYLNHRTAWQPPDVWLEEIRTNYTAVVLELRRRMRPGVDCLVLQTMYNTGGDGLPSTYLAMVNSVIREVANSTALPLLAVDRLVRNCPVENLIDRVHLGEGPNRMIAQALLRSITNRSMCSSSSN